MKENYEGTPEEYVEQFLGVQLREYEELIGAVNDTEVQAEDLRQLLSEANGVIALWCGPNLEAFDQWRFHMIVTDGGTYRVIQGWELNTDPGHEDATP